ncbi:MAG: DNA-binding protein, partial [Chitinophagaceae bacterium]|nr:DNA-binding protein [Chitinophagaceae bacterium]
MVTSKRYFLNLIGLLLISLAGISQQTKRADVIEQAFLHPPASAKPWVFWYWMHGAFSKEAITADLEAMKEVGIGGAYLMPIKDTTSAIPFQPTVRQLTPEWWALVKFAMQEAKRLGLQLGMHVSDGFALAGGPWITPELSMQKLVWTKTVVMTDGVQRINLPQPDAKENFYKDVAVFAYPLTMDMSAATLIPEVTTSNGSKASFLADRNGKGSFKSDTACWIQYSYSEPFTCRSITIHVGGNNYQAQRLIVQASDDGINFSTVTRLECPRHGWQDTDEDYTHAIPATTAKYFRFVYDKEGSEPGSEDLDAAKWRPSFKVNGIYLSGETVIHQYEAKNGSMWRVATATTGQQVTVKDAVPLENVINLTGKMDKEGNLDWTASSGNWMIVRIGHTSTGHTNYTGGAGLGLECDKFNAAAVKLQFDNWFA